ncbi:MAG: lysylphosphatidylglycerol synthase transmembrane domain-containing protein [Elusimicrobia bacterium]|nr:lysylphosphatidylglycerol synthase transmembrane domain-containing protein [Elusimicrobiota bacterium]
MKKTLQLLVGIAVSGLFLWLAFRKSDIGQIALILKSTRIGLAAAALGIGILGLFIRSYRWKLLGSKYRTVPYGNFFRATTMGLMLNTFLPFRTGDIFQGYFIARSSGLPQSYTLATVFMERMMDFVPPALMLVLGSFFVVLPPQISLSRLALIFAVVAGAGITLIVLRKQFLAVISRFLHARHSEKIGHLLDNVVTALGFLKDRQVLAGAVPLTLINWFILSATGTFLMLASLGIPISFFQAFLVLGITVMSVAIPASPGFVGTWEFFCVLALSIFHIDRDRALSYAVLSHVMAFIPIIVFGLFFTVQGFIRKHFPKKSQPV